MASHTAEDGAAIATLLVGFAKTQTLHTDDVVREETMCGAKVQSVGYTIYLDLDNQLVHYALAT